MGDTFSRLLVQDEETETTVDENVNPVVTKFISKGHDADELTKGFILKQAVGFLATLWPHRCRVPSELLHLFEVEEELESVGYIFVSRR